MTIPPYFPDFNLLWTTADYKTATEWIRLLDTLSNGIFDRPGGHDEGPATALVLLYAMGWCVREETNYLVFDAHKKRLSELLERWSAPQGGERSARYPFWRLQKHHFWRLMSWEACSERFELPQKTAATHPAHASVGVLDPRALLAVKTDEHLRYNLATLLASYYWLDEYEQVLETVGLPLETLKSHPQTSDALRCQTVLVPPISTPQKPPLPQFERHQTYAADELRARLKIGEIPPQDSIHPVAPDTVALFVSDASWRTKPSSTNVEAEEIHWPYSNRHYDDWLILDGLNDAAHVLVFTRHEPGQPYRYHGVYQTLSTEKRRWSPIRQIHDVVLGLVPD